MEPVLEKLDRRMAQIVGTSWTCQTLNNRRSLSRITIEAPVFDTSGYASSTRNLLKGLIELKADISVQPRWFKGSVDVVPSDKDTGAADYLILKDDYDNEFKYLLQIDLNEVERIIPLIDHQTEKQNLVVHMAASSFGTDHFQVAVEQNKGFQKYVGSTMFETDRIPGDWVKSCNRMDLVFVPSEFNVKTFTDSGVDSRKIRKVPLGVDTSICTPGKFQPLEKWQDQFVFFSIFEFNIRKGWDHLIKSFCLAFKDHSRVLLVIRSSSGRKKNITRIITDFLKSENLPLTIMRQIVVIEEKIPPSLLYSLYETIDAFVLPSRGEGWGMPYMEAMAFGKPVIGTNWGGNTEFMTHDNSFLIEVEKEKHLTPMDLEDNICFEPGHRYAEPSLDHLVEVLRAVYKNPELRQKVAQRGLMDVRKKWKHLDYAKAFFKRVES